MDYRLVAVTPSWAREFPAPFDSAAVYQAVQRTLSAGAQGLDRRLFRYFFVAQKLQETVDFGVVVDLDC